MTDCVGQQYGNYQLVRLLGQGGFAEVYLGEHVRLRTHAAIKVLRTQLQEENANAFLTEAQTIANLDHPHIVRILDFDVEKGIPFLVMNYAPGGTLRARHNKNTYVPLPLVVSYVNEVADALQYAHDKKVIHRDIKPENMLLGRRGEVLLSDFGIATLAHNSYSMQTQNVAGTIAYMAPEQIQAHPRTASDQYALAVVVYEWLCGVVPFEGTYYELISKHISMSPPSFRYANALLPVAIERVVFTALEKDPKLRFSNVRTFARELERASKHEGSFSMGISLDSLSPHSMVPSIVTANKNRKGTEGLSNVLHGGRDQNPGLQQSDLLKPIYNGPDDGKSNTIPNSAPVKFSRLSLTKNTIGRRRAIALLATGGAIVVGSTAIGTGIKLIYLTDPPAVNSPPIKTATQRTLKIATNNATQHTLSGYHGNVISSTTQPANSSVTFQNPKDDQSSILIHLPSSNFVAYEGACTHEGVIVNYDPETRTMICPAHGSTFDPVNRGRVLRGPAVSPLTQVSIQVNNNGTVTTISPT